MEGGLVSPTEEGTPQGGPLSPLLSNLMLDVLDKELEKRGHRFVRYADDCNIYVRSQRAGERVMAGIETVPCKAPQAQGQQGQERGRQTECSQVPGLQLHRREREPRRRIAPQAIARFKAKSSGTDATHVRTKPRTDRQGAVRLPYRWRGYFGFCQTPSVLRALDQWIRRRLRAIVWKQWKRGPIRFAELRRRGVGRDLAAQAAGSPHGPWRLAASPALTMALQTVFFGSLGVASVAHCGLA